MPAKPTSARSTSHLRCAHLVRIRVRVTVRVKAGVRVRVRVRVRGRVSALRPRDAQPVPHRQRVLAARVQPRVGYEDTGELYLLRVRVRVRDRVRAHQ